ncbi:hypothetical protein Tco_0424342 [Tanacetum coccineum]
MSDCNPFFKEKGSVRFSALYLKKKRNLLVFTSVDMIVMTSMVELESLFGYLFDELSNGENQVVSQSSAVTTADASDKCQQQQDSTSSTSTLATAITADGNFDLILWQYLKDDQLLFLREVLGGRLDAPVNRERLVQLATTLARRSFEFYSDHRKYLYDITGNVIAALVHDESRSKTHAQSTKLNTDESSPIKHEGGDTRSQAPAYKVQGKDFDISGRQTNQGKDHDISFLSKNVKLFKRSRSRSQACTMEPQKEIHKNQAQVSDVTRRIHN